MGPYERRQLVYRMLAVEQGPNDAKAGLVTEELEHPHGGLELVLGGTHIYLRIHADSIASPETAMSGTCRWSSS
jgi:hypothetical protein